MGSSWFGDMWRLLHSTVVYRIITYTVIIYFVQLMGGFGEAVTEYGALIPDNLIRGQIWRLLTYGALHDSNLFHLAFNMVGLWFFGRELESLWGGRKFFIFYLFGVIFSGFCSIINIPLGTGFVPIIGASGAVYGVLFAYAALFPDRELYLYFVLRIPVRIAVLLLTLLSVAGLLSAPDGIAHLVHLGGFAAGWIFYLYGNTIVSWFDWTKKIGKGSVRTFHKSPKDSGGAKMYVFEKKPEPTVDDILRKIHKSGMDSLTKREREILEEYSRR